MLTDKFIEGTGSPPLSAKIAGQPVGPRACATRVRQRPYEHVEANPFELAYEFVGVPVSDEYLQRIRQERNLSTNWGAVIMPKHVLRGLDVSSAKGIFEERNDGYVIIGILPDKTLRWDMRREYLDTEGIVFSLPDYFPGLNLEIPK